MAKEKQQLTENQGEKKSKYNGMYTDGDFHNWIVQAESNFTKVKGDYEEDREYFENEQSPSALDDDKEYVQENRLTDIVRRLAGQLISGKINPILTGGGKLSEPVKLLFLDILEENKFQELHTENIATRFYSQGYCGIKWRYNPFKSGKYGIGNPEIYTLRAEELWLDPNARDPQHTDDMFRIHQMRMLLSEAKERWPDHAQQITDSRDDLTSDNETEQFVDLYEIEFKQTEFRSIKTKNSAGIEKTLRLERDVWYIVKVVNKTVVVEGPAETGYPICRLIPVLHTPRENTNKGRYPFGVIRLQGQAQDHLNVVISIINEVVKKDIKNLAIFMGCTDEELSDFDVEAGKPFGKIVLRNPNAKIDFAPKTGLTPALVQLRELISLRMDQQISDFAPSRGEVQGDLSGKAINLLQGRGSAAEIVAQNHLESAFTDLGLCILTCIKKEMTEPFKISREIDGKEVEIGYNVSESHIPESDYNVVENGRVNYLKNITMQVKVEVEMNTMYKRQLEIQLAQAALAAQKISTEDYLKALWPKTWQEKLVNLLEENEALRLMREMAELGPEFIQTVRTLMNQFKPKLEAVEEGLNERKQKQGQRIFFGDQS